MAASLTIHSSSFVSSTNSDIMNAFVSSPLYKQNKLTYATFTLKIYMIFSVAIIFAILLCVPCSKNRDWPKMYLCLHSFCSEHGLSSTQDKTKNAVMSLKENSNDYHKPQRSCYRLQLITHACTNFVINILTQGCNKTKELFLDPEK